MNLSPDDTIYWQYGIFKVNETIAITWAIMLFLLMVSIGITRRLTSTDRPSKWQSILEIVVIGIKRQIEDVGLGQPEKYISFVGTLFLFIAVANLGTILPGYEPPTASLSTTAALAISVFIAVPVYSISESGLWNYLKNYLKPTFIMLPFNIISELSRTLALAVRLFGNMMSGSVIAAILLAITPLFFPVILNVLGLLTGMVQAYIFSVLAAVYIAAAAHDSGNQKETKLPKPIKDG